MITETCKCCGKPVTPIRKGMHVPSHLYQMGPEEKALEMFQTAINSPFDGRMPSDNASLAAVAILKDLQNRRGIKDELQTVDFDIQYEITDAITEIIRRSNQMEPFRFPEIVFSNQSVSAQDLYRNNLCALSKNVQAYLLALQTYGFDHEETLAAFESMQHTNQDIPSLLDEVLFPVIGKVPPFAK